MIETFAGTLDKKTLRRTARLWGIQPDYCNFAGKTVAADDRAVVQTLETWTGQKITSPQDLAALADRAKLKKYRRGIEPVAVIKSEDGFHLPAFLPAGFVLEGVQARVFMENVEETLTAVKVRISGRQVQAGGEHFQKAHFEIEAALPVGYHRLEILQGDQVFARCMLLRTPPSGHRASSEGEKRWGIFAPTYALRSKQNWGVGDLRDISDLQEKIFAAGGSFVGVLPILATSQTEKHPSPYSPVSRLFWNEMYLHVPDLLKEAGLEEKFLTAELRAQIETLKKAPLVDYEALVALKKPVLKALAKEFFQRAERPRSFDYFLASFSRIEEYAQFMAAGDPDEYQYQLYVQYQMDQALHQMNQRAENGESAGLYLDFPVGTSTGGFDSQVFGASFLKGLTTGAPPDLMFHGGQNWGFEPLDPLRLREEAYEYFILCMRQHMRYARILRLDHVMAFKRLYVIAEGNPATEGVYIRYNPEEFFAILNIESYRSGVQVVGENLGTVPESITQALEENHCFGMWVFPFEAGKDPRAAIEAAKPHNLACLNTHDMVPFAGFIGAKDVELYQSLGMLTKELAQKGEKERRESVKTWMKSLRLKDVHELLPKILELVAAGPCELLLINLEDLWLEQEPQNVPGTWKEYPNWKKKLARTNEDWLEDPKVQAVFKKISSLRRSPQKDLNYA